MENIKIENIWERGFEDPDMLKVEKMCREKASSETGELIEKYNNLKQTSEGKYISSDLMKMVFPFYLESVENRKKYNLAVSNSAACLANSAYKNAVCEPEVERCIFVAGPYGSGKSFMIQSLFEKNKEELEGSIVYEGSITSKAIDGKIDWAIEQGKKVDMIILNPTFELSLRNIKERAGRIGRDVRKEDAVFVYANIYSALKRLTEKYPNINYVIYNKETNIPKDMSVSTNIEELNHGSIEEVSKEYDEIMKRI